MKTSKKYSDKMVKFLLVVLALFVAFIIFYVVSLNFIEFNGSFTKEQWEEQEVLFSTLIAIIAIIIGLCLAYIPYTESNYHRYQDSHRALGGYVPNREFDKTLSMLERRNSYKVPSKAKYYTTDKKDAKILYAHIKEWTGVTNFITYDETRDIWLYNFKYEDSVIKGETASFEMAVCTVYYDYFKENIRLVKE